MDRAKVLEPMPRSVNTPPSTALSRRVLVGSPDYLARHGRPTTPDDLATLDCVRMSNIARSDALVPEGPNGETHVAPMGGRLRVDHRLASREAYLAVAVSARRIFG